MLTLVVGGAGSGKSAYAESLVLRSMAARRVYAATMEPRGREALERIQKHRIMRENKWFVTAERFTDLEHLNVPPDSAVLLEDVGNLCANELFSPAGSPENAAGAILRGVEHLRRKSRDLVIVSNEVFTGGADYQGDTVRYLSILSYVNRRLAELADNVCEVAGGIAVYYKGEEA